jgi:hypothetical protein
VNNVCTKLRSNPKSVANFDVREVHTNTNTSLWSRLTASSEQTETLSQLREVTLQNEQIIRVQQNIIKNLNAPPPKPPKFIDRRPPLKEEVEAKARELNRSVAETETMMTEGMGDVPSGGRGPLLDAQEKVLDAQEKILTDLKSVSSEPETNSLLNKIQERLQRIRDYFRRSPSQAPVIDTGVQDVVNEAEQHGRMNKNVFDYSDAILSSKKLWMIGGGAALAVVIAGGVSGIVAASRDTASKDDTYQMEFQNVAGIDAPTRRGAARRQYFGLDPRLKVVTAMLVLRMRDMCTAADKEVNWDDVQAMLNQCILLRKKTDDVDFMSSVTSKEYGSSPDKDAYLKKWFHDLIHQHDTDVEKTTRMFGKELDALVDICTESVTSTENAYLDFFYGKVHQSLTIIDMSMIRFPTPEVPYIKVYRLRCNSSFDGLCGMFAGGSSHTSALRVELNTRTYEPNDGIVVTPDVIARLDAEMMKIL